MSSQASSSNTSHTRKPKGGSAKYRSRVTTSMQSAKNKFIRHTNTAEKLALVRALEAAIVFFLDSDQTVYIEGLGFIIPQIKLVHGSTLLDLERFSVESKRVRTIAFEKSAELTQYHRDRWGQVAELNDLNKIVGPLLPHFISWENATIKEHLRGLIKYLIEELVSTGSSDILESIGTFYALHNRQGESVRDWFAGADIFFEPRHSSTIEVLSQNIFARPILESSCEIGRACYGSEASKTTTTLKSLLNSVDALDCCNKSDKELDLAIDIYAFQPSGQNTTIFISNGLRYLREDPSESGTELVFQIRNSDLGANLVPATEQELLHHFVGRVFAFGAVLMLRFGKGSIQPGQGINIPQHFLSENRPKLNTLITTGFSLVDYKHRAPEMVFNFVNLLLIHSDECDFAAKFSLKLLLILLKRRNLHEITSFNRKAICFRSEFANKKNMQQLLAEPEMEMKLAS